MNNDDLFERYRSSMLAAIEMVFDSVNAEHKTQLRTELEWLKSWCPAGWPEPVCRDFHRRHTSIQALFGAIIEPSSLQVAAGPHGSELMDEISRASILAQRLANPNRPEKRMRKSAEGAGKVDFPPPVFIVSSWRSGSSLLTLLLGSHKNLTALPELNLLGPFLATSGDGSSNTQPMLYRTRPAIITAFNSTFRLGIAEEQFYRHFAIFINSIISEHIGEERAKRWVYKEFANAASLPLIDIMFGYRAYFIWLVRHGLDVVNSMIERYERRGAQRADLADYAREWAEQNELFADFCESTPDRSMRVHYEDLISDPHQELRRILSFLDEPWDENIFSVMAASTERLGGDHKLTHSGGKIDRSRTERWRAWPSAYAVQFGKIVSSMLQRAGYDPVP